MINNIEERLRQWTTANFPFTNVLGLARSVGALGLLLTLLVNSTDTLFFTETDGRIVNPLLQDSVKINQYNFFMLIGKEHVFKMKLVAILVLVVVISGYWFKITAILHWWISISFVYFSSIIDGGDQIAAILTLMLIPVLLFDKRKNHWEFEAPNAGVRNIIPIITITVIRLQVALIYFHASVGKYAVPEWTNGTAIYYWWNNTVFGMPLAFSAPVNSLLAMPLVVSVLTYSVLIFEIVVFLALTGSIRYRKNLFPFAILFHLLIILMHGIFSFFFAITMALILFLQPTNIPFKFNFLQLCQKQ